jgi:hypothetical protein
MQTSKEDDGTPISSIKLEQAIELLGQRLRRDGSPPPAPRLLRKDGEALLRELEISITCSSMSAIQHGPRPLPLRQEYSPPTTGTPA